MKRLRADGRRGGSSQDIAYRWLKRHVAGLPRHEGAFLTEAEVSEATRMSRTPVREALLRLEAEGLLRIVPKKGAFVPPVTDEEVEAVIQARVLVEDWCVRRAAPLAGPLSRELEQLVARQEKLRAAPRPFIECDREFHRAIVRSVGNPVLADFYESLRDRQLRMGLRAVAGSAERTRAVLTEHASIAGAVRSGDPAAAAAAVAEHLASTLTALRLPAMSRWVPGPEGRPAGEPQ